MENCSDSGLLAGWDNRCNGTGACARPTSLDGQFGVAVANFCKTLPDGPEARRIRGQLADPATSVAANYRGRAAARSPAEFMSKIAVCAEEADESHMWLQMCADVGLAPRPAISALLDETEQLRRIFIASQLTAKSRNTRTSPR